tara:strand:- start:121448 stop:121735 length:288 start_codon:yes stop_codon:yes gene_type:complete
MTESNRPDKTPFPWAAIFSGTGASILIAVLVIRPKSNELVDIDHVLQFGVLLCIIGTIAGLFTHKLPNARFAIALGLAGITGFFTFVLYVLSSGH